MQPREVRVRTVAVERDDPVAATIEARALAERDVNVDRQQPRDWIAVAFAHRLAQRPFIEVHRELRRGRVRGVSGAGPVVAAQQGGVKSGIRGHDESLSYTKPGAP